MRAIRGFAAAAVSTMFLAGCGTGNMATGPTTVGGYRLYGIDTQHGGAPIDVIEAAGGRLERSLPAGTPSPDWSRLYVLSYDASRTSLASVSTANGNVLARISFDGAFVLPWVSSTGVTGGISPNGQWLVAQSVAQPNHTDFMLISTTFTQRPRRISLPGDFSFDAISNDGQRLYLIESLALSQAGHYRVRLYDVDAGALNPRIVIDKREIETGSMTGTRISGVVSPDGRWQYSLYIDQKKGAFIHALNLETPLAWCIDLPAGGGKYEQMMWSLAINPAGNALFAVNPTLGRVARIDITPDGPSNELTAVRSFSPAGQTSLHPGFLADAMAKGMQTGSSALTPDGKTLIASGEGGTVSIDAVAMKLQRQLISDPAVESVVLSDDGASLFASSWSGPSLIELNPITGARVQVRQTDSAWTLLRAGRR